MQQQIVKRTAWDWSFHVYMLADPATQIAQKTVLSFPLKKKHFSMQNIQFCILAWLCAVFCCCDSAPLHSCFAPVCATLYYIGV